MALLTRVDPPARNAIPLTDSLRQANLLTFTHGDVPTHFNSLTRQADAAHHGAAPTQREGIGELLSGTGIADGAAAGAPAPRKRTQEVETNPDSNPNPSSNAI